MKKILTVIESVYDQFEPREKSCMLVKPDKWNITDLSFTGNYHLYQDFLRKTLDLEISGDFSSDEIINAIDRLYGLGGFERIYYNLIDAEERKNLNLDITIQKGFTQNIGIGANTIYMAAILISTTRKNYTNAFRLLSTSVELSVNPGLSIMAESNETNLPTLGINIKGKYQNYNVFDKSDKVSEANIFYTSGALYLYQPLLRNFNFGIRFQEEYYRGDIFGMNDNYTPTTTTGKKEILFSNVYSYMTFDNVDNFYIPSKRTNLYADFSLLADLQENRKICPIFLFKLRNVIPVWKNTTLLFDRYSRTLYNSNFSQPQMTLIGGESYSQYFNYHLQFVDLSAVNIAERFAYIGLVGFRFRVASSQYVSVLFNGLQQSSNELIWEYASMIYCGGIRYSLKILRGPPDVIGYSGSMDKPTFSANFEYWF